ncbi:hypothetical protein [Halopiger aswanensis]|uniref:Uncharacterized protein n=1 Tax=Halopiger aswanensis TaxID=148449 RepID=A0A3R7GKP5_9EURY|nr:hypothetical protein [Halopiger aswanensis]RKD97493.1 hypothetical protein ATJ93_0481 [Halopiger aswanensis]
MDEDPILLRLNLITALLVGILAILLLPLLSLERVFFAVLLVGIGLPLLTFGLLLVR